MVNLPYSYVIPPSQFFLIVLNVCHTADILGLCLGFAWALLGLRVSAILVLLLALPGLCLGFAWALLGLCLGFAWLCLGFAWALLLALLGFAFGFAWVTG